MEYFGKNKFLEELKEFIENKKNKIKIVAVPVLVSSAPFMLIILFSLRSVCVFALPRLLLFYFFG